MKQEEQEPFEHYTNEAENYSRHDTDTGIYHDVEKYNNCSADNPEPLLLSDSTRVHASAASTVHDGVKVEK